MPCHAMHPIQDLFLESVSYALQFDMHFYMHSYVEKKFILVKMGVTANPMSCKWVKQQGPAKGFDFDETKVEQIFDLLLREKQLKLPEGHKFPTTQELHGRPYCKWHHLFTHTTNDCKVLCR
jgi:hypothetical protein